MAKNNKLFICKTKSDSLDFLFTRKNTKQICLTWNATEFGKAINQLWSGPLKKRYVFNADFCPELLKTELHI